MSAIVAWLVLRPASPVCDATKSDRRSPSKAHLCPESWDQCPCGQTRLRTGSAAMDRSARRSGPLRIALFAYPGVQGLDLSGPLELFARATRLLRDESRGHPGYSLTVVGTDAGPLTASSGFRFLPDSTFRALRGEVDTLLVVGGLGVDALLGERAILGWLRRMAGRVRRVGSVCTGAFLLAEAGLLDGRTVTTHWSRAAELARRYPRIRVEEDRIWARDGGVYSSAGVSAGMDLALALIEEDL